MFQIVIAIDEVAKLGENGFLILVPQVRVLPGAPPNKGQQLKKTELLAFSFSLIFSLACHRLAKTSRVLQNIAPKIAPGFTPKMATVTKPLGRGTLLLCHSKRGTESLHSSFLAKGALPAGRDFRLGQPSWNA